MARALGMVAGTLGILWAYPQTPGNWLLGIAVYAAMGLQGPLGALVGSGEAVTDAATRS